MLKPFVLGHACAETVASELVETLEEFSLPLKCLLSLFRPIVNKAIKININYKLMLKFSRQLIDTACQLHVVQILSGK